MKVLFVAMARSIWLFDFARVNPKGLTLQPFIESLSTKYAFAKAPRNVLDLTDNALVFKSGRFVNAKGVQVLISLSVFDDGLVADALSSTDDSTAFLTEVSDWAKKEFGLIVPEEARKSYASQIVFQSDVPFVALNPRLSRLVESIQERYAPVDAKRPQFEFTGLSFWTEDVGKPLAPGPVKIERKIGALFADDMYFSQAPFETNSHLEFLSEFETMLKES